MNNKGVLTADMIKRACETAIDNFPMMPNTIFVSKPQFDYMEADIIHKAVTEMYILCTPLMAIDLTLLKR